MRIVAITLTMVYSLVSISSAQTVQWGAKAGVNSSSVQAVPDYYDWLLCCHPLLPDAMVDATPGAGFTAGLFAARPIRNWFGVQGEVLLSQKRHSASYPHADWGRTMTGRYWLVVVACLGVFPQAQENGFTPLFNGKDLTGWVYGRRAGGAENRTGKGYQVENGILFTTKEDGGNLFTEKQYADFVLRFEFKLTENANNGIGIRAPLEGDAAYTGIEIQVLDDSGSEYRTLRPAQYHGSIYHMFPAKRGHQKPVGEWNSEEITVKGRQITVTLNGVTITEGNLDDVKDEELLSKHRVLSRPEGSRGIANTRGHVGLLGHGTRVEFRNIRIKEL